MTDNKDTLDRILAAGAAFDWITPLYAMTRDAAAGDAYRVKIRFEESSDARFALKQAKIESWGWTTFFDVTVFSIHERDARRAAALLGLEPAKPRAKRRVFGLGFLPWLILIVGLALVALIVMTGAGL